MTQYYHDGPVDIFLHEGLVDDAIAIVDNSYSYDLIRRVMLEVIEQRPKWVVKKACKQAEDIMDAGQSAAYHYAVDWLDRAREAYRIMDHTSDWEAYLSEIRKKHGRKYKLMGLIEEKWTPL